MLRINSHGRKVLYRDTISLTVPTGASTNNVAIPDVGDIAKCIEVLEGWTNAGAQVAGSVYVRARLTAGDNLEVQAQNMAGSSMTIKVNIVIYRAFYTVRRYQASVAVNSNEAYVDQAVTLVRSLTRALEVMNGFTTDFHSYGATARVGLTAPDNARVHAASYTTAARTFVINFLVDG